MNTFFGLSTKLFDKLNYKTKFLLNGILIGLFFSVLLSLIMFNQFNQIQKAQQELNGLSLYQPTFELMIKIQEHNTLSNAILNGYSQFTNQRQQLRESIKTDWNQLISLNQKYEQQFKTQKDFELIKKNWESALNLSNNSNGDNDNSLMQHQEAIRSLNKYINLVADNSGLKLDSNVLNYYLVDNLLTKIPLLFNKLGDGQSIGVGIIAQKRITPTQKNNLTVVRGSFEQLIDLLNQNLEKIKSEAPTTHQQIEPKATLLFDSILSVQEALTTKVIDSSDFDMPVEDYQKKTSTSIQYAVDLTHQILPLSQSILKQNIETIQIQSIILIIITFVLSIILMYLFMGSYLSVIQAIHDLETGANQFAKGDLTVRINLSAKDEISRVANSFNQMADEFNKLIGTINYQALTVTQEVNSITESTKQISHYMENQSESCAESAATIEEISANIIQISENITHAVKISHDSEQITLQIQQQMNTSADKIVAVSDSITESAIKMKALAKRSEEINRIISIIKDIADQTNLLALNAAIEAARAGDYGRSFAVVADEVRNLASSTSNATAEISETIAQIQKEIQNIVQTILAIDHQSKEGVKLVKSSVHGIDSIKQGVLENLTHIESIDLAMQEQSEATHDLALKITRMSEISEETFEESRSTASNAIHLNDITLGLKQEIQQFKI